MKNLVATCFLLLFCLSCGQEKSTATNTATTPTEVVTPTENFDWLLGNWQRTNDDAGELTYEMWTKDVEGNYLGHGYTMQGQDTTFQEDMKFIATGTDWQLDVITTGEMAVTTFAIVEMEANRFVAENHEIEFPNRIVYIKEGDQITATISNADMSIPFVFQPIATLPK